MKRDGLLVLALVACVFLVEAEAPATPQSAPVWSHPKFSVHWTDIEFLFDETRGLEYASVNLVDNAGNLVGTCIDWFHDGFEEWEYTFYYPGTTDVAGTVYVPKATFDPDPTSSRSIPGSGTVFHFIGEVTNEQEPEHGHEHDPGDLEAWTGGRIEMRGEVGDDGSFGCACTFTAPELVH